MPDNYNFPALLNGISQQASPGLIRQLTGS